MPQQADRRHGSENTGAGPVIWKNDGSYHSGIAGDTICIECADGIPSTEEDPPPCRGAGLGAGAGRRAVLQLLWGAAGSKGMRRPN